MTAQTLHLEVKLWNFICQNMREWKSVEIKCSYFIDFIAKIGIQLEIHLKHLALNPTFNSIKLWMFESNSQLRLSCTINWWVCFTWGVEISRNFGASWRALRASKMNFPRIIRIQSKIYYAAFNWLKFKLLAFKWLTATSG